LEPLLLPDRTEAVQFLSRLQELIKPAARASIVSGVGRDWLVDLGRSMDDPEMILHALMGHPASAMRRGSRCNATRSR
jgi:hypothetical protein